MTDLIQEIINTTLKS